MDVTYRSTDDGWEPVLSTGERLDPAPDLATARAAVRERFGADATETVQVPLEGHGVVVDGVRFELLPPLYGADDHSPDQDALLTACAEYYRERVPSGVRVECAGHRVRIDPAPFGLVADLFSTLDGTSTTRTAADARTQLTDAMAIAVPDGFVRVVHQFDGLEEFGEVGHFHLVLADRWPGDAPCL
ncbi:hypothetical protein [Cryptosporangium arvum]|uniref:hypothetical protein n=1 Tax=Cryptosporangium arvum TaxID=80871 RepID=UPI0004AFA0DD|nr:hypothetical protein [Cryptosporangium arvum]